MSYSWAKPGVKVVCVDNKPAANKMFVAGEVPIMGAVYTIDSVGVDSFSGDMGVTLVELKRCEEAVALGFVGYRLARFRPLVTKSQEQDVALFRKHLVGDRVTA